MSTALETALERAGIRKRVKDGAGESQGVFNLLRHTYGSRLALVGTPFGVIATLMRNTAAVAERHYIRFAQSDLRAAMLAMEAAAGAGTGADPDRKHETGAGDRAGSLEA